VFRRRSSDASELIDQDPAADGTADGEQARPARSSVTAPKGAPTPKRSEAQSGRRQPYQAPTDRKAASQQSRERGREDRVRRTQALQRGEQWALPRKDQGPVRSLARDVVDARRGVGEYYMVAVVALIVLLVLPGNATKLIADTVVVALLLIILVEGWFVGNRIKKLAAERFPGQSTQGVMLYTTMRSISLRRMRVPKPRVDRGDKV
jgi:Protein of unknown function (DUF3043)